MESTNELGFLMTAENAGIGLSEYGCCVSLANSSLLPRPPLSTACTHKSLWQPTVPNSTGIDGAMGQQVILRRA